MKIYRIMSWVAVIVWMCVIFYLSDQVASDSSQLSSGITEFIMNGMNQILPKLQLELVEMSFFVRKAAHFTAYFILGALLLHACWHSGFSGVRGIVLSFIIAVLYAISDEVHQLFVPGRSGEIRDVVIDSAGALSGIFVCLVIWLIARRWKKSKQSTKT